MAQPRNIDDDLGTREEDWPEVDVNSDEEGAEAMRRAEAAMHATIERSIRQQSQQHAHEGIPEGLYIKAQDHQDQLTDEERHLFLSRGDVVGKALAYPDSLTTEEIHEAMFWPPPDKVRANIQRATGGILSSPSELYAKAKEALDRGQLKTALNSDEIALLSRGFYAIDDEAYSPGTQIMARGAPGAGKALNLIFKRLGLPPGVTKEATILQQAGQMEQMRQPPPAPTNLGQGFDSATSQHPPLPPLRIGPEFTATVIPPDELEQEQKQHVNDPMVALIYLQQQHRLGNITDEELRAGNRQYSAALEAAHIGNAAGTRAYQVPAPIPRPSHADLFGSGPWPPAGPLRHALTLFQEETGVSGWGVEPAWAAIPEETKQAYRARSETLRQEAWAEHNAAVAAGTYRFTVPPRREEGEQSRPRPADYIVPGGNRERFPKRPALLTGLGVFRDELGEGVDPEEALARYNTLAPEQKSVYTDRANKANTAARLARLAARRSQAPQG